MNECVANGGIDEKLTADQSPSPVLNIVGRGNRECRPRRCRERKLAQTGTKPVAWAGWTLGPWHCGGVSSVHIKTHQIRLHNVWTNRPRDSQ